MSRCNKHDCGSRSLESSLEKGGPRPTRRLMPDIIVLSHVQGHNCTRLFKYFWPNTPDSRTQTPYTMIASTQSGVPKYPGGTELLVARLCSCSVHSQTRKFTAPPALLS
eukprot:400254-Rhodomonas_salina.1